MGSDEIKSLEERLSKLEDESRTIRSRLVLLKLKDENTRNALIFRLDGAMSIKERKLSILQIIE